MVEVKEAMLAGMPVEMLAGMSAEVLAEWVAARESELMTEDMVEAAMEEVLATVAMVLKLAHLRGEVRVQPSYPDAVVGPGSIYPMGNYLRVVLQVEERETRSLATG